MVGSSSCWRFDRGVQGSPDFVSPPVRYSTRKKSQVFGIQTVDRHVTVTRDRGPRTLTGTGSGVLHVPRIDLSENPFTTIHPELSVVRKVVRFGRRTVNQCFRFVFPSWSASTTPWKSLLSVFLTDVVVVILP